MSCGLGLYCPKCTKSARKRQEKTRWVVAAVRGMYLILRKMHAWNRESEHGIACLSRHEPQAALRHFGKALELCPENRTTDLWRILFYLGIVFRKLGLRNSAIRSWVASQKLHKRGYTRKMLLRFSNEYGMEKQATPEQDDWLAFRAVHTARYLRGKKRTRFTHRGEERLITDLIRCYWDDLGETVDLEEKSATEKGRLFREVRIEFPAMVLEEERRIPVNFYTGRRMEYGDRCRCGSGLPYGACCGRTPGMDELRSGVF